MTVPVAQQPSDHKNLRVRIKMRVKLANGSRAYVDPVFASNGTLKPFVALVGGKPTHHPEAVYHLRYVRRGKRVWEPVGKEPQLALSAKMRTEHRLQTIAMGLTEPDSAPLKAKGKTELDAAIKEYLSDIAAAKSKTTLAVAFREYM
jgi:integrase/recombinase XerD